MAIKKTARGSKHHNTELREHDIVLIRSRYDAGEKQTVLCKEYNLSAAACSNIVNRRTWKHITEKSGVSVVYKDEYHIWRSMIQRCTSETHVSYPDYGGRGIKVCDEWLGGFHAFLKDLGPRPTKGHSLDRINPDGNYQPDNVRWATGKVQARNKRNSVYMEHPKTGEKVPAANIADFLGIPYREFRRQMIEQGKWPRQLNKPAKEPAA